ncbi:S9 family peptidase [Tolypothrix campylonemoides VB511288]|nr:S9 family peptidase [Tolypothrix campylonemoides VB511288]
MKHRIRGRVVAFALSLAIIGQTAAVDVEQYIKRDKFNDIKISPTGEYLAATVPLEDRTVLAVIRRSDNAVLTKLALEKNNHVSDFVWVNDQRLIVSAAQKFGELDTPQPTGELFAVSADGSDAEILVGYRVQGRGPGSKIQDKKAELVAAFLVDSLPADDRNVVIAVWPFSEDPYTRAERLDVHSGRRAPIVRAPVRNAAFTTDNAGIVRFALGAGADNNRKLYHRAGDGTEWELISEEKANGGLEVPIGFSADNRVAYLLVEQPEGPDAVVEFDPRTRSRRTLVRDDIVDPAKVIYRNRTGIPVGVVFMDGKPRTHFFDAASPEARLQKSLEAAFADEAVTITSQTADGKLALVQTRSDRNPGDYFLFDTVAKKATHLLSRADWIDPASRAAMAPVTLRARDGLDLHGYLTTPSGRQPRNLPLILMPHGGPFGIRDDWGFDSNVQMLADAGYAVLQVNFRGSGGYGRAYHHKGAKEWGKAMQDDLTDATRWAVAQGIADPARICIYGASYGAYASLMGVAKEPSLYRCAAGNVGVYDLPMMHSRGDISERRSGENYLMEWLGPPNEVAAYSPNRMADRIKVPVFLAAGGEDERAPIEHTRRMERALKEAGVPVESVYFDTEGHGYYKIENRRTYYTRLLSFFARHLGGAAPAGGAAAAK